MRTKALKDLDWKDATPPQRLCFSEKAPASPGIYELGFFNPKKGGFVPKYIGKAADQSLRDRLAQHFSRSHNEEVQLLKVKVWFRCIETNDSAEAGFLESHFLIAFREQYEWNRRNEWVAMWALDPSYRDSM